MTNFMIKHLDGINLAQVMEIGVHFFFLEHVYLTLKFFILLPYLVT